MTECGYAVVVVVGHHVELNAVNHTSATLAAPAAQCDHWSTGGSSMEVE
jgi:hypothetical protein